MTLFRARPSVALAVLLASGGCAAVKDAMTTSDRQLIKAAEEGRLDDVKAWLDKGVDVNAQPGNLLSRTALMVACERKQDKVADYLLSRGADPRLQDNGGRTALHFAAAAGDGAIVRQLKAKGADPDAKDADGRTPLFEAASRAMAPATRDILEAGATVDLAGPDGATPLNAAAAAGAPGPARWLLLKGADKTIKNAFGESAADIAARRDDKALLELFSLDKAGLRAWKDPSASAPAAATAAAAPAAEPLEDVEAAPKRRAARPDDYALVIGIEDYQSIPKADYGVRDAEAVRRYVQALGVPARNVIALEGPAATGSKLKSYLEEWLPLNVKPDSTLYVYYSGHGAPDPATGEAYLVPWDGDPQFLKSTAYPLSSFYAALGKTKAKRVVVALDACFSGAGGRSVLPKGARPLVTKSSAAAPTADHLVVLAAASGEEITGTVDGPRHGLFTYYFLKGLRGEAKTGSGAVTPASLYEYLKTRVSDEARRQNRSQTPVLLGSAGDDAL